MVFKAIKDLFGSFFAKKETVEVPYKLEPPKLYDEVKNLNEEPAPTPEVTPVEKPKAKRAAKPKVAKDTTTPKAPRTSKKKTTA